MNLVSLVTIYPAIRHGQAGIRSTRIPVSVILDILAAGLSHRKILEEDPTPGHEGIRAANALCWLLCASALVWMQSPRSGSPSTILVEQECGYKEDDDLPALAKRSAAVFCSSCYVLLGRMHEVASTAIADSSQ
jgi:uncharacterized protein (DUF433 family)